MTEGSSGNGDGIRPTEQNNPSKFSVVSEKFQRIRSAFRRPTGDFNPLGKVVEVAESHGIEYDSPTGEFLNEYGAEHAAIVLDTKRQAFDREDRQVVAARATKRLESGITDSTSFHDVLVDLALLAEQSGNDELVSPHSVEDPMTGMRYQFGEKTLPDGKRVSVIAAKPLQDEDYDNYTQDIYHEVKEEKICWYEGGEPLLKSVILDADDGVEYKSKILQRPVTSIRERRNGSRLWTRNVITPSDVEKVSERILAAITRTPEDQEKAWADFERRKSDSWSAYSDKMDQEALAEEEV